MEDEPEKFSDDEPVQLFRGLEDNIFTIIS